MHVCMLSPFEKGFIGRMQADSFSGWMLLKGLYGGQLLTEVGIDAIDYIYPVAWATVSKENKDNWKWFLELLAEDCRITNSYNWAFVSDRQKVHEKLLATCALLSILYCHRK